MFKKKITIEKDLFERAARFAKDKGYSDLSEWISDLMEEEMKRNQGGGPEGDKDEEEIKKKLQGLGYIS
jgi:metal-responsive CopG/Arc/MetJ family transcriptional regulator